MVRPGAGAGVAGIVGRESELKVVGEFVAAGRGALILKGGPGTGKTALWEAGRDAALARGVRVLSARRASQFRPGPNWPELVANPINRA